MATSMSPVESVFSLYKKYGQDDYLGEAINQVEHATQCAMLAEKEGFPNEVVLGAFLHDVGHLLGKDRNMEEMVTNGQVIGIQYHEKVGEEFLKKLGFPKAVTDIVRGHVAAKRYLVYKSQDYYNQLTDASKMTLVHQGGPMTAEEAEEFEKCDSFEAILKMRRWDEQGKESNMIIDPLEKYENMCRTCLGQCG